MLKKQETKLTKYLNNQAYNQNIIGVLQNIEELYQTLATIDNCIK